MVLKLYGFAISTCTQRVKTVLYEKKVPFEMHIVNSLQEKSPALLEKQPFGQVPYIVDEDGFELYESRATSRYIAFKYASQGTQLVPAVSDLKAYAKFEQGASIESSNFDPYVSGVTHEKIFAP